MHLLKKRDYFILDVLQKNCRQAISDIGNQIGISTSACHRRIKQLEEYGVIEGYVAQLDAKKLGYSVKVLVEISLLSQSQKSLADFESAVQHSDEILECHLMAGDADYILTVAARNLEDYERLHREVISHLPGVASVKSNMTLRTVKHWKGLKLIGI